MPFTKQDLDLYPIRFEKQNGVTAIIGPCTGQTWTGEKIPLDGRHYECGGSLILKNGETVRASFRINTSGFDFLERNSVYVPVDDTWYSWDELELLKKLGLTRDEAFPFFWQTDRPLDYHNKGPYPMRWPDNKDWDK
jgi:hypothetical protein